MDLNNLAIFTLAKTRMDYLAERKTVIADNVANADTPGYAARDLREVDFKSLAEEAAGQKAKVTRTHAAHLSGPDRVMGPYRESVNRRPFEVTLDKNGVVIEEQMLLLSRTRGAYERATTLFNKTKTMLRTAIGSGGSS